LNLEIALPPLNEQRRIVTKLEKLLGRVDAAQARLAKIPIILKRYRQSVLAAACSGRLTADWRKQNPNINGTFELIDDVQRTNQKQNAIATKTIEKENGETEEFPCGWKTARIRDICISSFYGPRFGRTEYTADGVPTIRTTDMTDDGRIILKDAPRVKVRRDRLQDFRVLRNDLLVTRTGSIGLMAIFKDDYVAIPRLT
jgi:type I restriction enzyme S subunit